MKDQPNRKETTGTVAASLLSELVESGRITDAEELTHAFRYLLKRVHPDNNGREHDFGEETVLLIERYNELAGLAEFHSTQTETETKSHEAFVSDLHTFLRDGGRGMAEAESARTRIGEYVAEIGGDLISSWRFCRRWYVHREEFQMSFNNHHTLLYFGVKHLDLWYLNRTHRSRMLAFSFLTELMANMDKAEQGVRALVDHLFERLDHVRIGEECRQQGDE